MKIAPSAGSAYVSPSQTQDSASTPATPPERSRGPTTQAADLFLKLKPLAPNLTLGFLGEDSGDPATAFSRRALGGNLDADHLLSALGYKDPKAVQQEDGFSFNKVKKGDKDFWEAFTEFEQNNDPNQSTANADQAKALFTSPHVKELATLTADTKQSFNTACYLVAKMDDGSVLGLRGMVGSMGG